MTDIPVKVHLPWDDGGTTFVNLCSKQAWQDPTTLPKGTFLAKCPDCVAIREKAEGHTTEALFAAAQQDVDVEAPTFEEELRALINKHSREGKSDTSDFILADYLVRCLEAFEMATRRRTASNCLPTNNDIHDC